MSAYLVLEERWIPLPSSRKPLQHLAMASNSYAEPLLLKDGITMPLPRLPLDNSDSANQYNEDYVRNLAFDHPSCLPIAEIDSAYRDAVPVCKELNTPAGPLDALFVTPEGRIVVLEAKLWRNPEARRKVVAQILDYAKELSRWSYEDLQRSVSAATGRKGNSLMEIVRERNPDLNEAEFVDAVSRGLKQGRFLLLIVGDGIREGAASIAEFMQQVGTLEFTFGLVELALYGSQETGIFVQPRILAKTEIIQRQVVVWRDGRLTLEEDLSEQEEETEISDAARGYLDFWTEFKAGLQLDDPNQPIPKASKNSNLDFSMPPSGSQAWITSSFRTKRKRIAVYIRFSKGNLAERFSERLLSDIDAIKEELGPEAEVGKDANGNLTVVTRLQFDDLQDPANRGRIKQFFAEMVNRYVNTFKPRLERILEEGAE